MHTANIFLLLYFFPAEQARQDYGGGLSGPSFGSISNCIEWTSDWSPCSHSCGPGVSTRNTNRNWACRLQTETRLCQVRLCQTLLPGLRRLQPVSAQSTHNQFQSLIPLFKHLFEYNTSKFHPRICRLQIVLIMFYISELPQCTILASIWFYLELGPSCNSKILYK